MKSYVLSALVFASAMSQAQANTVATELDRSCLSSVISAVNKHHTLAEGGVYALRVLYKASFGAALLVGHSDETDPTDYLVSVDLAGSCKIKSIVYVEDASSVAEYSQQEIDLVNDLELEQQALKLMQKIPTSSYDARALCIVGNQVTAIVPMTHWSANDRKTATGSLKSFPQKIEASESGIEFKGGKGVLVQGSEGNGIYAAKGTVNGKPADICLKEVKALLE